MYSCGSLGGDLRRQGGCDSRWTFPKVGQQQLRSGYMSNLTLRVVQANLRSRELSRVPRTGSDMYIIFEKYRQVGTSVRKGIIMLRDPRENARGGKRRFGRRG